MPASTTLTASRSRSGRLQPVSTNSRYERLAAFRLAADAGAPDQLSGDDARLLVAAGSPPPRSWRCGRQPTCYRAVRHAGAAGVRGRHRGRGSRDVLADGRARLADDDAQGQLDPVRLAERFEPNVAERPRDESRRVVRRAHGLAAGSNAGHRGDARDRWSGRRSRPVGTGAVPCHGCASHRPRISHRCPKNDPVEGSERSTTWIAAGRKGGGFAKVKASTFLDDHLHILPNPVRDAVIIGSVVDFLEKRQADRGPRGREAHRDHGGDPVRRGQLDRIRGPEERPQTPAKRPDRPQVSRGRPGRAQQPNGLHAWRRQPRPRRTARSRRGRGRQGHNAEAAPSVTIFVQSVPAGLPNINLNGRRGGRGQDGQDGGHGEDGARGRESGQQRLLVRHGRGQRRQRRRRRKRRQTRTGRQRRQRRHHQGVHHAGQSSGAAGAARRFHRRHRRTEGRGRRRRRTR